MAATPTSAAMPTTVAKISVAVGPGADCQSVNISTSAPITPMLTVIGSARSMVAALHGGQPQHLPLLRLQRTEDARHVETERLVRPSGGRFRRRVRLRRRPLAATPFVHHQVTRNPERDFSDLHRVVGDVLGS